MAIEVLGIDPRCLVTQKLPAPAPLPYVSRRALGRVRDRLDPPAKCDCCGGTVKLVNNSEIYNGRSYGDWPYAYLCTECGAYVGLHPKTDLPLGTMADEETRQARKDTKEPFTDLLEHFNGDRNAAYEWLAGAMGIEKKYCHFGLFTTEQCDLAWEVIEQKLGENYV
ncbi:MAG TPA: zinc-finger-containing protein [Burkholderiaceae bacterium]|nr:zinc-finger-containing protein [Burkholderiaceae bacterium]